jgi:hypothetical protein
LREKRVGEGEMLCRRRHDPVVFNLSHHLHLPLGRELSGDSSGFLVGSWKDKGMEGD